MRTIRVEILSAAISWYSTTIFRLRSSQVVQGYLRYTIASATSMRYRFGLRSSHCHAYDTVFFYFMQLRYSSPWTFLAYHCTYDISCDLHTIFSPTIVACHAAWQTLALSSLNYSFTQITHLLTLTHTQAHTHTHTSSALSFSLCTSHTFDFDQNAFALRARQSIAVACRCQKGERANFSCCSQQENVKQTKR